jgi:hypothetical protein
VDAAKEASEAVDSTAEEKLLNWRWMQIAATCSTLLAE